MPTTTKTRRKHKHLPGITVDPNMPDYSKDPFFIKKAEEARAFIERVGLPKEFETQEPVKTRKSKKSK